MKVGAPTRTIPTEPKRDMIRNTIDRGPERIDHQSGKLGNQHHRRSLHRAKHRLAGAGTRNRKGAQSESHLKQRRRSYRHEIIRRGIDPRFTIKMVKEILRRFGVTYSALNIAKSATSEERPSTSEFDRSRTSRNPKFRHAPCLRQTRTMNSGPDIVYEERHSSTRPSTFVSLSLSPLSLSLSLSHFSHRFLVVVLSLFRVSPFSPCTFERNVVETHFCLKYGSMLEDDLRTSPWITSNDFFAFVFSLSLFLHFVRDEYHLSHSLSVSLPPSLSLSIKTDRDESRRQIIRACDSRHLLFDSSNKALRANARSSLHRSPSSLPSASHTHTPTTRCLTDGNSRVLDRSYYGQSIHYHGKI